LSSGFVPAKAFKGSAGAQLPTREARVLVRSQFRVVFVEGVGDSFEEDEAEDGVLVFRRVHVVSELVGGRARVWPQSRGKHQ